MKDPGMICYYLIFFKTEFNLIYEREVLLERCSCFIAFNFSSDFLLHQTVRSLFLFLQTILNLQPRSPPPCNSASPGKSNGR